MKYVRNSQTMVSNEIYEQELLLSFIYSSLPTYSFDVIFLTDNTIPINDELISIIENYDCSYKILTITNSNDIEILICALIHNLNVILIKLFEKQNLESKLNDIFDCLGILIIDPDSTMLEYEMCSLSSKSIKKYIPQLCDKSMLNEKETILPTLEQKHKALKHKEHQKIISKNEARQKILKRAQNIHILKQKHLNDFVQQQMIDNEQRKKIKHRNRSIEHTRKLLERKLKKKIKPLTVNFKRIYHTSKTKTRVLKHKRRRIKQKLLYFPLTKTYHQKNKCQLKNKELKEHNKKEHVKKRNSIRKLFDDWLNVENLRSEISKKAFDYITGSSEDKMS